MSKDKVCPICDGDGRFELEDGDYITCENCDGLGFIEEPDTDEPERIPVNLDVVKITPHKSNYEDLEEMVRPQYTSYAYGPEDGFVMIRKGDLNVIKELVNRLLKYKYKTDYLYKNATIESSLNAYLGEFTYEGQQSKVDLYCRALDKVFNINAKMKLEDIKE
jgi:hypothetical protein